MEFWMGVTFAALLVALAASISLSVILLRDQRKRD